jgi:hypothetical protein
MSGVTPSTSCKSLLKRLKILTLPSEYIFPYMNFVVNIQEQSQANCDTHSLNTSNNIQLYRPTAKLLWFQNIAYYTSIKIFGGLSSNTMSLINDKEQFKVALRWYFITHSFYSVH